MDSDHRHELKENDLAEFLAHLGEWWSRNGLWLVITVSVIVIVFASYQFVKRQSIEASQTAWTELATETSPGGYRALAKAHAEPRVRDLAHLRGGDLLLAEARRPSGDADAPAEPAEVLDEAAWMYRQVLDQSAHPLLRINALGGLASVAETAGDWEAAAGYWRQALELAGTGFTTLAQHAEMRLNLLKQWGTLLRFWRHR